MLAYERDAYLKELDVTIVGVGSDERGPYALLDDTVLYPEGGGQPADGGLLDGVSVHDMQKLEGDIRHYVETPVAEGAARLVLDWERRFDHMQQHTAQHVITAVAADEFGWETTAFHLGARTSDIELDVASLSEDDIGRLERRVVELLRADLSVGSRRVTPQDLESLDIRSRGLPEGHRGDVRLVEIAGVDLNTCGGTHVASTAQIETVKLLGTEPMRGGLRLHWVAGGRVRSRLAEHEHRAARLRRVFEAADDEIVELAGAKLTRLKESERELRQIRGRLAEEAATRLAASDEVFIEAHFEGVDAGFLQRVGGSIAAAEGPRLALLTASNENGDLFALAASASCPCALRPLGDEVAEILAGRGGGSPELFQGKAGSLKNRDNAIQLLKSRALVQGR